jgi:hypothetical protein
MSPTFLVIAHAGEVNGVEQWDEDEYPTMAGAVCALAKWSLFTRDAVIRRVGPDGTVGPVVAELDVPRDGSYESAITFQFPSRRKDRWIGRPNGSQLTLRGLLARYGIPE